MASAVLIDQGGLSIPHQFSRKKVILIMINMKLFTLHNFHKQIYLSNNVSKTRVAKQKPTSWSDTICLVLKLSWVHFSKVLEPDAKQLLGQKVGTKHH